MEIIIATVVSNSAV